MTRPLATSRQRVKTGKGRTLSSKMWLERQLNDPYVQRAKREGYRSRAAFKLVEIDDKYRVLKKGARVVDLGAAPGGWSQVAAKRGAARAGRVVAIDLLDDASRLPGVDFIQLDFLDPRRAGRIEGAARRRGRRRADRHGGERHRAPQDRSHKDRGAGRGRSGICARSPQARRCVSRQGDSGRHRAPPCWPSSSAISPPCATSSRRRAVRIPPSFICSRRAFAKASGCGGC